MADDSQTISIPSLILLAAVTTLAIRYFFFTKADPNAPRSHPRAANPADIEQIATMFPQLNRRDIIWDLQRNGGSVAATTERVLSRGTLEQVRQIIRILERRDGLANLCLIDSLHRHSNHPYQQLQRRVQQVQGHRNRDKNILISSSDTNLSPRYQNRRQLWMILREVEDRCGAIIRLSDRRCCRGDGKR